MNKTCLTVVLLVIVKIAFGQNTSPFPSNGNVGIGTTNPAVPLDVSGSAALAGNNSNLDNRFGNIPLSFLENSGKVLVGWNRTGGAGEIDFIGNQGGGNVGGFAFFNHDNSGLESQLMYLTGDGRLLLGVGTGVTGNNKLAVGGGIIAESVTVKLQSNWPDYVFEPAYHLPTLTKVQRYINENRHLPEIPSEKEMLRHGINLGEMNRVLLKKVEELTLYLIENEKHDRRQQEQINALNRKLNVSSRKVQGRK